MTASSSSSSSSSLFLVINCENSQAWKPLSFADMFISILKNHEDVNEVWHTCNIASGDALPLNIIEYKGVVLTGSHYNVRDNLEWYGPLKAFIQQSALSGYPKIYGGCFGHQLIAASLTDGVVDYNSPSKNFVLKAETLVLTDLFYSIFPSSTIETIIGSNSTSNSIKVIESHGDCVIKLPKDAKLLASSSTCINEIMVNGINNNILSCQSHPEFDLDYAIHERIWLAVVDKNKRLTDEEVTIAKETFHDYNRSHGSDFLASIIKYFIHQ